MALSGDEIRSRLSTFAAKWSVYAGSEQSEAQTFLNQLFACYGQERRRWPASRSPRPVASST